MSHTLIVLFQQTLGDVDDEVTHLLKLLHYVDVEHSCLVVLAFLLDVDYVLLTQAVAVLVDVIFSVLGVGYVLEEEG